ncbi:hypothetical protein ADUPG1_012128, partial [Aduncisulcus paluster]
IDTSNSLMGCSEFGDLIVCNYTDGIDIISLSDPSLHAHISFTFSKMTRPVVCGECVLFFTFNSRSIYFATISTLYSACQPSLLSIALPEVAYPFYISICPRVGSVAICEYGSLGRFMLVSNIPTRRHTLPSSVSASAPPIDPSAVISDAEDMTVTLSSCGRSTGCLYPVLTDSILNPSVSSPDSHGAARRTSSDILLYNDMLNKLSVYDVVRRVCIRVEGAFIPNSPLMLLPRTSLILSQYSSDLYCITSGETFTDAVPFGVPADCCCVGGGVFAFAVEGDDTIRIMSVR